MSDLKDILKEQHTVDPEVLKQYFDGTLDDATRHSVEAALANDDPFLNDAVEGLQQHSGNLTLTMYEIEKKITTRIKDKAKQKTRKPFLSMNQIVVAVMLILLLIAAGYGIIRLLAQK
jgi:hypothetical protein